MRNVFIVALLLYCGAASAIVYYDKDGKRHDTVVHCYTDACANKQADLNAKRYGKIVAAPGDVVQYVTTPPEGFTGDAYMWRVHHESKRAFGIRK